MEVDDDGSPVNEAADVEEEMGDDSSSDEEELDEEVDEEVNKQIESVKEKLSTSPYHYQLHTELITLLRKAGEFEELQDARERMAKIFPLTQNLWLDWIEDEKKFAETDGDHERIVELFERAVKDYICPEVWLEYAQYAIRWLDTEGGMSKIRDVMERSLTAAGIHVTSGSSLWETYREFENAILMTMQPGLGSVPTPQQQDQMKKQMEKVESLFRRQLAVPLLGMESTYQEFKEWCGKDVDGNTEHSFHNAMKQLKELKPHEDALAQATAPKLEEYYEYVYHEMKSADPPRIQCIYERALADNCLSSDLWVQYLKYLTHMFKHGEVVVDVHLRSVRNCPWVGHFWVQYLLALERNGASKEKLNEAFEEALSAGLSSAFEYVELWRTKCEQVRRRLTTCQGDSAEELRACFSKATEYIIGKLLPAYSETGDPDYVMWRFWARCEAECLNNKGKAKEVLQNLMGEDVDARRKVSIYRELYDIERLYGGDDKVEQCRSILRQAVQNCAILADSQRGGLPDAEVACGLLLDFERCHGTLEDMDESMRRVVNKMAKVTKRREKDAEQHALPFKNKERAQKNKPKAGGRKRKLSEDGRAPSKQGKSRDHPEPPKRAKGAAPFSPAGDFKAPAGLPARYGKHVASSSKTGGDEKTSGPPGFKDPVPGKGAPPGFKGPPPPGFKPPATKGPPPGFKGPPGHHLSDPNNNKDNEKMDKDAQNEDAHIASIAEIEKSEEDSATIFVSNLDFRLEDVEDKLRSVFCDCGNITDVRLAKNNKGQFRGFGYIQFAEDGSAAKALELDRQVMEGRPMYVSPNVDKKKQPNFKVFKYGIGLEKHKLFVSNVSFNTTEETLQKEFSEHGNVKSARIVTNRKGHSKGLAYVEYENQSSATQAVMKMDGKEIDGFAVKVAISNPPSRRPEANAPMSASLGAGGGRDRFKGGRGRGRTQISMLPRTLQRSEVRNGAANKDSKPSTSKGGMSNKDFAALLLKK